MSRAPGRRRPSPRAVVVSLFAVLALVTFVVEPVVELVRMAAEGEALARLRRLFELPIHREAIVTSLLLSLATVLGCALVGGGLALATFRLGRLGALLRTLSLAPLFVSPVMGTIAFYFLLARGGLLARLVPGYDLEFRGFGAVLTVHILTMSVYFLLFVAGGLARLDANLVAAARSLGATPFRALRTVVLPLLSESIFGAAALTFMSAMASFTAPLVFGSGERYLTTAIATLRGDDPALSAALSLVLTSLSLLAVAALRGRDPGSVRASARGFQSAAPARGLPALARVAIGAALTAAVILPLLTLVLVSLKPDGRLSRGEIFEGLGLQHYRSALAAAFDPRATGAAADLMASIGRSALFALVATVLDLLVALALVLGSTKWPRLLRAAGQAIALLPLAIPGTVVALSLVAAYATRGPLGLGPSLLGSGTILVVAYVTRNLPILVRAVVAGHAQLPTVLPEAARTLGAGPVRTLLTVTLPFLAPSLLGGFLLAFVTAMGEFVASILLWVPETRPASVAIYDQFRSGLFGPAAAAGVLLALATGLLLGLGRLVAKPRRRA